MIKVCFAKLIAVAGILFAANLVHGNITFNATPDPGTPQYVVDAFSLATARWSTVLRDDITVNINFGYQSLPTTTLGQTASVFVQQDYATVAAALNASASSADDSSAYSQLQSGPAYSRLINHTTDNPNGANSATPYVNSLSAVMLTRANAKALGLVALDSNPDATMQFNSTPIFPFDFNPTDGVTPGQFDFVTISAHEIGHALGFESIINKLEQIPSSADQLPSTVLDLFRFSSAGLATGAGFSDVTADTRDKWFSVNGGSSSVAFFASGAVYGTGYQANHWRESSFTGLMDPNSYTGLSRRIGPTDTRAFDVIGYKVPEPGVGTLCGLGMLFLFRTRKQACLGARGES